MTFSVHWAIVTDSREMYEHVMTSTSLSSRNPSIILNRFLVKWMECLLLWENKSKALCSINQIKIMWKFRLSKKEHSESSVNLALHQAYAIHLHSKGPSWPTRTPPIIFSMLSTCQLSPLISQRCLPSSPICYVHRWALLPFLPCQPSCMEEAPINISKPTSLLSLKCV